MSRKKPLMVTSAIISLALVLSTSAVSIARTYSTNFPLSEDPISEGGNWVNGGSCDSPDSCVGLDWNNIETTWGLAFGLEPGSTNYTDATALLQTGTWGSNQTVQANVFVGSTYSTDYPEVEIRLLSSLSPNICTGYEINFSAGGNNYAQIVRWNGAVGDFTYLANCIAGEGCNVQNGDVIMAVATVSGGIVTIKAYKNGTLVPGMTARDSTYTTGSPGMGFNYGQCSDVCQGSHNAYGFTSYTATDGVLGALPSAPTGVSATAGDGQATVTFSPPASDGGSPITGYTVTSNPSGGIDANAGSTSTTHTVTRLTNGTAYAFTVTATNIDGTSAPSTPSNSVTPDGASSSGEVRHNHHDWDSDGSVGGEQWEGGGSAVGEQRKWSDDRRGVVNDNSAEEY